MRSTLLRGIGAGFGFLVSLGFEALATTSSGAAAALGRLDGGVSRDEALMSAAAIAGAVDVPVSTDLENGFADDPAGVARTVEGALARGLVGCSVEDFTRNRDDPIYALELAVERIAAAAEVAHRGPVRMVLTARAENHLHGCTDLGDTVVRLQRYQAAGADVLFAPGIARIEDIRTVVTSLDRPVTVLVTRGSPPVAALAAAGVRRVSVGDAFAFAALGALVESARELRERGTYAYLERTQIGLEAARAAFVR